MANSLGAMSPQYWSRRMGRKLYKTDVFRGLANFEEQAVLTDGQKVDRPYRSNIVVENYTKGTALVAQDLTATDDVLQVNVVKAALLYVDNVDKIQNKYSAANAWIDEAGRRLSNSIDANFLYQVFNANNTVDDGSIGGVAGNGIVSQVSNFLDILAAINIQLDVQNVPENEKFLVLSPQFFAVLWKFIAGRYTMLGDRTGQNGNLGAYADLDLFKSNNLTGSATLTTTATPSNNDTFVINGVTFTGVTVIGAVAGNVYINGSAANFLTNIAALINAAGVGDGVNNVSLALADQRTVQNWIAVATATTLEVRAMGASYMAVTSSNAANVWTAALQLQNLFAGRYKCTDAVIQKEPSVEMGPTVAVGKSGTNILPMTLFGVYTFFQGKNEMVRVKLRSDSY